VGKSNQEIKIDRVANDWDELNYLAGHTVEFINEQVFKGTLQAHTEAGVPNIVLNIPEITPYTFGYLVFFFQLSCTVSSYLLGVNPFDQPGVEAYKEKVNELLGQLT
jgi:glucose-6-phosphate isomerase